MIEQRLDKLKNIEKSQHQYIHLLGKQVQTLNKASRLYFFHVDTLVSRN